MITKLNECNTSYKKKQQEIPKKFGKKPHHRNILLYGNMHSFGEEVQKSNAVSVTYLACLTFHLNNGLTKLHLNKFSFFR